MYDTDPLKNPGKKLNDLSKMAAMLLSSNVYAYKDVAVPSTGIVVIPLTELKLTKEPGFAVGVKFSDDKQQPVEWNIISSQTNKDQVTIQVRKQGSIIGLLPQWGPAGGANIKLDVYVRPVIST